MTVATPAWQKDELEGYERQTFSLPRADDGELVATLVRRQRDAVEPRALRGRVLYLHGYVDYFFHAHLAKAYLGRGYDLQALDLRRSGRSLRPGNVPHQFRDIDEYFQEIDWAIEQLGEGDLPLSAIIGHSTGALVACHYAARGRYRETVRALVLNSPFFEFRANSVERAALGVVTRLGALQPRLPAPVKLNPVYGHTLHESFGGEWIYDLGKKPLGGFGVTAGWIAAVAAAHARLQAGLDISCPILVQHSSHSRRAGRLLIEADRSADLVLDVEHMKSFAKKLGSRVELQEISGGLHDLTLSAEPVRARVIEGQLSFLERQL